jgi:CheY-like chemotaxis protein
MADRKRILILDDSWIALELEKTMLEDLGHEVAVAANLREFEDQLAKFQPEIILTDLMMPEIGGHDVVRALKRSFHTERIPIIIFSSKPDEELAVVAEQAGADGYLSKSRGLADLGDMVDRLIDSILW